MSCPQCGGSHEGHAIPDNRHPAGTNPSLGTPISADGTPELGRTYEVPARQGKAVRVARGQTLRIVNTHGTQVCDLWAFCRDGLHEALSMEHLRAGLGRTTPRLSLIHI